MRQALLPIYESWHFIYDLYIFIFIGTEGKSLIHTVQNIKYGIQKQPNLMMGFAGKTEHKSQESKHMKNTP